MSTELQRARKRPGLAMRTKLAIVILLAAAAAASTSSVAVSHPMQGGGRCRTVVRRVHGKRHRVRVCKKRPALPQAGTVTARIDLGAHVASVAAGDGTVWATTDDQKLLRVDPATNTVVATIALPESEWPENVAYGNGAAWVTVASPDTIDEPSLDSLLRVDPVTNRVVARIHVGHSPEGIAFTPGAVWTANHRSESTGPYNIPAGRYDVSRVSTASNAEAARILVETRQPVTLNGNTTLNGNAIFCCGPQGIAASAGAVWVADPTAQADSGMVFRIDPRTNAVTATIHAGGPACGAVAADDTQVWVSPGCDHSTLVRIDPSTNAITARVEPGGNNGTLALGFGSVWVPIDTGIAQALVRIDPTTNKVAARTQVPGASFVAAGGDSLWVGAGSTLVRVRPA